MSKFFLSVFFALYLGCGFSWSFDGIFSPKGGRDERGSLEYFFTAASQLTDHAMKARILLSSDASDSWSLTARSAALKLGSGAMANRTLWSPDLGFFQSHTYEERRVFGAQLGVGSPSDRPFYSWNEIKASMTAFYQMPSGKTNSYWFFLNYSNHRGFLQNIPLPGFAYLLMSEDKKLMMLAGVPFFLSYSPIDRWWIKVSLLMPPLASFEISTMVLPPIRFRAALQWVYQDFLLSGRTDSKEQYFFDQKKAILAAQIPVQKWLSVDLSAGYSFGRRAFSARSYFKEKNSLADLADTVIFSTGLTARF